MVGQEKLLKELSKYTVATLPKNLLFFGPIGSGRHTIVNELAKNLSLPVIELTTNITDSQLLEYQCSAIPSFYLINLDYYNEKQQNQFLKFIEEPSETVFIALIATSEALILPTIANRCIKYSLEQYTEQQLSKIATVDNTLIYKICRTPGQLLSANLETIPALHTLCSLIINKLKTASYSNSLSIATKINYSDEYDKHDFNLFLNTLEFVAYEDYIKSNTETSYFIYSCVNHYRQIIPQIKAPIQENFMLNLLTTLWEGLQAWQSLN